MILKPYPAPERPSLRLKMYAAGALVGKRAGWGHGRKWEGNYLVVVRSVSLSVCHTQPAASTAAVYWTHFCIKTDDMQC